MQGVRMLKEPKKQERYIDDEEFGRLYEAAFDNIKPVLLVAFHTGMRTEEFLSLKWSQVYLNDPPVKIVGSSASDYGHIEIFKTKNNERRFVPINETLWNWLVQQERIEDDYVFKASHGGRYRSIKDQFKHALKRAGLKDARIHDLRGSRATRMNEKGADPYTIMEIGGWSSLLQLQRYLRFNKKNAAEAIQRLDTPHPRHIDAKSEERQLRKVV